ncbi:hypothetical protein [Labrys sp. 22185]|uniref:hypothetical protein n=1 Tax=Labrys sp. 22185 TaxID=3453888 RepID=UPI003F866E2D
MKLSLKLFVAAGLTAGSMLIAPQIASAMPMAPSAQSQADNGLVQQIRRLCPYGMHRSPYGCVPDRGYRRGWRDDGGWRYRERPRRYYRDYDYQEY